MGELDEQNYDTYFNHGRRKIDCWRYGPNRIPL